MSDKIERIIDALRKKILEEAIRGNLVPQNPEDEPASKLLERIAEERERMIKEKKIKKPKSISRIFRRDGHFYESINGGEPTCIDDDIPFEIPDSWEWVRLGNIGIWGSGATPNRNKLVYYNGNIPWLKTGDLTDGYITDIPEYISELALEKTSVKLNPAGSVLIAMYGATIGKLGILTFPATTNQACCACIPYDGVNNHFLFYYLLSQRNLFIKKGEGGAQPNISKEKITQTFFPLPPTDEQKEILEAVTSRFKKINVITDSRKRYKRILSETPTSLRQKLIQAAIQGQLVPQNPNDEPASILLERITQERTAKLGKKAAKSMSRIVRRGSKTHSTYHEIFSDGTEKDISEEIPFDIPETWEWSRLGSFVEIKSGSTYKEVESGILYVKVGDMNLPENKIEIRSSTHFAECPDNAIIPAYSIIFPKRGGAISTNKKRTVKNFKICVDLNTMAISFPAQIFDFARVWFDNIELEKIANGSTIPQINNKDVEPLLFPLPPLVEQLRICNRLGKMLRTIDDTREQQ